MDVSAEVVHGWSIFRNKTGSMYVRFDVGGLLSHVLEVAETTKGMRIVQTNPKWIPDPLPLAVKSSVVEWIYVCVREVGFSDDDVSRGPYLRPPDDFRALLTTPHPPPPPEEPRVSHGSRMSRGSQMSIENSIGRIMVRLFGTGQSVFMERNAELAKQPPDLHVACRIEDDLAAGLAIPETDEIPVAADEVEGPPVWANCDDPALEDFIESLGTDEGFMIGLPR